MKKNNLQKYIAISIFIFIQCLVFVPITHANSKNPDVKYPISINYLGLNKRSTHIDVTANEYRAIKNILQTIESDLQKTNTDLEARIVIENGLEILHNYGLFENMKMDIIKKLCVRQNLLIRDIVELPTHKYNQKLSTGGDNAFCVLLSHIKGYVYDHGLLFVLAILVALSSLPFIIIFYPIGAIFNAISEAIFSLQNKKPFIPPFPHRVETRYNESYSNLVSRGFYGRVNNDYTNWGFRFDAFTGVRINLGRDESLRVNESYYLGSALFVSWNYDGPH